MLSDVYKKIANHERITTQDALLLAKDADFLTLGRLANERSKAVSGNRVSYLIDRNINYTNVCRAICRFCAFYRPKGHKESYELTHAALSQKIEEALAADATQVLLQGGIHPDYKIDYYVDMIAHIKKNHHIQIHAFSPPEIDWIAKNSNMTNVEAIRALKAAGLGSIPGGGAEILVDAVRDRIAVDKCNSQEWLDVMAAAHSEGIRTTATMMFGHVETWHDRIAHLEKLRALQDKTHGFIAFIPWTFQPEHTALNPHLKKNTDVQLASGHEYLRLIAVARLFLDNFDHIQASNLTQGIKVGQMALNFGADDMGSIMLEENVVSSAGCDGAQKLDSEIVIRAIIESGHEPFQRDTFYDTVFPEKTAAIAQKFKNLNRYAG